MTVHKISILILVLTVKHTLAQVCDKSDANKYLNTLFGRGYYVAYDGTRLRSFDHDTTRLIETPILNKLLPEYCFYSTSFESMYLEYRNVEATIALRCDTPNKSTICLSPVFTTTNKAFLNIFTGLHISDSSTQIELCREIASIFSNITYKGRISLIRNLKNQQIVSFELWHDDLSWAIFDFHFNRQKLTMIDIKSGAKRSEIGPNYKRLAAAAYNIPVYVSGANSDNPGISSVVGTIGADTILTSSH